MFSSLPAETVRATVVSALRVGIASAGDSYAFGQPRTDGHTYGTDLWRFVWHEMAQQSGSLPGAAVRRPRNSFLVDLGDAVLYPFRYAADRTTDIASAQMADSQFRRDLLADPRTAPHLFWPNVVLIPYAANPNAGLLRAFLGGARITDQDVLDWLWLEELDLGDGPPAGREPKPAQSATPPFARAPEPELDLQLTDPAPAQESRAGA